MNTEQPEWIKLQNKQWTEKDGTIHNISEYNPHKIANITYQVSIAMPITNKKFYHSTGFTNLELTNKAIKKCSKIAKQHLLDLMFEELLDRKLKNE
jgi:hypothetical protein